MSTATNTVTLVKKASTTFWANRLAFRLQDDTTGHLDIEFKKLGQEKIEELFAYETTRVSEVFDEIVSAVRGYGHESPEPGGKPIPMSPEENLAEARAEPSIVSQTVEHFFNRMRRVRPGEKTLKRWA